MKTDLDQALEHLRQTREITREIKKLFDQKKIMSGAVSPYQGLLILTLNETEQFLDSIELLCQNNFGDIAVLVKRTLFEIYITIKFLNRHPEFVERYFAFGDYIKEKRLACLESYGVDIAASEARGNISRSEIQAEATAAKAKHNFTTAKWYPPSFPTLRDLCEDAVDKENYDVVYKYICDFSHFNVLSLVKHTLHEDTQSQSFRIEIERKPGLEHLQGACAMVLAILQHFNLEFGLGLEENLAGIQKSLGQSVQ